MVVYLEVHVKYWRFLLVCTFVKAYYQRVNIKCVNMKEIDYKSHNSHNYDLIFGTDG